MGALDCECVMGWRDAGGAGSIHHLVEEGFADDLRLISKRNDGPEFA